MTLYRVDTTQTGEGDTVYRVDSTQTGEGETE